MKIFKIIFPVLLAVLILWTSYGGCIENFIKISIAKLIESTFNGNGKLNFLIEKHQLHFMDMILKSVCNNSVQIEEAKSLMTMSERRRNCVIFLSNFEAFAAFQSSLTEDNFITDGLYIFVMEEVSDSEAEIFFAALWKKFIYNANILTRSSNQVVLKTFLPFNANNCNDMRPIIINRFNLEDKVWEKFGNFENFFPKKFNNFYNCSLSAVTTEYAPAVMLKKRHSNGTYELRGSDIELVNGLKSVLNFYLNLTFLPEYGSWGIIYTNGSSSGAKGMVKENQFDFTFAFYYIITNPLSYVSISEAYFITPIAIIVPSEIAKSSIQKLFMPFSVQLWVASSLALLTGLVVITLIEFRFKKLKHLIIGSNIRAPFMEFAVGIFGGSSHVLPHRNFARYLLAMFLIFCLVLRSVYQSELFRIMKEDKQTVIRNIDELMERKMTIYTALRTNNLWDHVKFKKL
jgi:hypothetical protein